MPSILAKKLTKHAEIADKYATEHHDPLLSERLRGKAIGLRVAAGFADESNCGSYPCEVRGALEKPLSDVRAGDIGIFAGDLIMATGRASSDTVLPVLVLRTGTPDQLRAGTFRWVGYVPQHSEKVPTWGGAVGGVVEPSPGTSVRVAIDLDPVSDEHVTVELLGDSFDALAIVPLAKLRHALGDDTVTNEVLTGDDASTRKLAALTDAVEEQIEYADQKMSETLGTSAPWMLAYLRSGLGEV